MHTNKLSFTMMLALGLCACGPNQAEDGADEPATGQAQQAEIIDCIFQPLMPWKRADSVESGANVHCSTRKVLYIKATLQEWTTSGWAETASLDWPNIGIPADDWVQLRDEIFGCRTRVYRTKVYAFNPANSRSETVYSGATTTGCNWYGDSEVRAASFTLSGAPQARSRSGPRRSCGRPSTLEPFGLLRSG